MASRNLRKSYKTEYGTFVSSPDDYKDRCFQWRQGLRNCTFEHDDGKNPGLSVVCMQYAEAIRTDYERSCIRQNPEDIYPLARELGWTDNDSDERARELVEQFFQENPFSEVCDDKKRQGLLLIGGCGSGKTYMAAAIANELCEANENIVMVQYDELRDYMIGNDDYSSDEDIIGSYLDLYYESDNGILVIDDLFSRTDKKAMDFALLLFDMMTCTRKSYAMVVTANLTKEDMINPPPDKARIISRLRELCTVVETGNQDRRTLVIE